MARTKKFNLPKYLRLAKGLMWFDIDGENASGIKLYRNMDQFVGRGNDIKTFVEEEEKDRNYPLYHPNEDETSKFEPAQDKYHNENSEHGEYGFIEMKDKSWFCTDDVEPEKLAKILTAYQNGILIKHNPRKEYKEIPMPKQRKNFKIKKDGDIVFSGTNTQMFNMLNNRKISDIREFIISAGDSSKQNLMDLYQYELKGYNNISRPRGELLDLIRNRLNELGPGISAVRKGDKD